MSDAMSQAQVAELIGREVNCDQVLNTSAPAQDQEAQLKMQAKMEELRGQVTRDAQALVKAA